MIMKLTYGTAFRPYFPGRIQREPEEPYCPEEEGGQFDEELCNGCPCADECRKAEGGNNE